MHDRVVPGFGVAIASFWPTSAFRSVLLPTFGLPTIAHRPARGGASGSSCFARGAMGAPTYSRRTVGAPRRELLPSRDARCERPTDHARLCLGRARPDRGGSVRVLPG